MLDTDVVTLCNIPTASGRERLPHGWLASNRAHSGDYHYVRGAGPRAAGGMFPGENTEAYSHATHALHRLLRRVPEPNCSRSMTVPRPSSSCSKHLKIRIGTMDLAHRLHRAREGQHTLISRNLATTNKFPVFASRTGRREPHDQKS